MYAAPVHQALLTEGMADQGFALAFAPDGDAAAAELLRPLGIPYDADTAAVVRKAKAALESVTVNLRILLDEDRLSWAEAREYGRRWLFEPDGHLELVFSHLAATRRLPAAISNALARPLCERWVAGDPARLKPLLSEQLTTADLIA